MRIALFIYAFREVKIYTIMIYAPVIIPTLNRFEHFKNCLESLEACVGAEFTDVYVALDYPPSEKYVEGWKKIDIYLHEKEKGNNFHSLTVYRRETNYFFSGKGNWQTAVKDATINVDRYIFSEDDNIFSPNFLEFINKGLEKYKNDSSVLAICGYSHPYPIKYSDNNYFMQNVDFSAWGYGIWKDRIVKSDNACNKAYFRKKLHSLNNLNKLKKHGLNRLLYAIQCAYGNKVIPDNDNTLSIYMVLESMNVVMPTITKVRNMGWDGTGVHCQEGKSLENIHTKRIIDDEDQFDFIGDGMNYYDENMQVFVENSYARCSYLRFFKSLIKILIKR